MEKIIKDIKYYPIGSINISFNRPTETPEDIEQLEKEMRMYNMQDLEDTMSIHCSGIGTLKEQTKIRGKSE